MGLLNLFKTVISQGKDNAKPAKKTKKKVALKPQSKTRKKAKAGTKKVKKKKVPKKTQRRSIKKIVKKVQKRKPAKRAQKLKEKSKEKQIGKITHYFGKISVGIVKLKSGLKVGDKIHMKGAHDDFKQVVKSMQYNHKSIMQARRGLEVGIKVTQRVHENDMVYIAA